jgi:hypothetical protein
LNKIEASFEYMNLRISLETSVLFRGHTILNNVRHNFHLIAPYTND